MSVAIGFMYAVTRRSSPLVMPPSRPPALFVGRDDADAVRGGPTAGRISSWMREPGSVGDGRPAADADAP